MVLPQQGLMVTEHCGVATGTNSGGVSYILAAPRTKNDADVGPHEQ